MTSPLSWSAISDLLRAHLPDFDTSVQGVDRALVERMQRELDIQLPSLYVDMLVEVGESAGPFHPFGPTVDADFYGLVALLPTKTYPSDTFFKVARHVDPGFEPEEPYLDLRRCTEHDGPMVTRDHAGPFTPQQMRDLDITLAATVARSAFRQAALLPQPEHSRLFVVPDDDAAAVTAEQQAITLLEAMGYAPLLPRAPRFACFSSDDGYASVDFPDPEVLAIELAGPDAKRLRIRVEQLLDAMPDAELHQGSFSIEEPQP